MKKEIYTLYSAEGDMTFIMEDTYVNGEIVSTEMKGFYCGEPETAATKQYYGGLKAEY